MNYQSIVIGMTGQQFSESINGNFTLTEKQFELLAANILTKVGSDNVKQLKVENNILYYTTDETNWKPVDNNVWGNITGNIQDQNDLMLLLEGKADDTDIEVINNVIAVINNQISGLSSTVTNQGQSISQNTTSIGNLQTEISDKVSSDVIKKFRISSSGYLEYSTNNTSWSVVQSLAEINWGAIGGSIANQVDLQEILNSKVSEAELNQHRIDTTNPHEVTKAQVGLSDVDNTSDANKPLSLVAEEKFTQVDTLITELQNTKIDKTSAIDGIEYVTLEAYNSMVELGTIDEDTIYFVD